MAWRRPLFASSIVFLSAFFLLIATQPNTAVGQKASPSLAPGVMITIPALQKETRLPLISEEAETFTGPFALADIPGAEWTPNFTAKSNTLFEKNKSVILRREILWTLEFEFKPVRMIRVDVPQPSGKMRRKLVWYMVYRVRNLGYHLAPDAKQDTYRHVTYEVKNVNKVLRFFPLFVLESHDLSRKEAYLDRVIPAAIPAIRRREKISGPLYDSVSIMRVPLEWSQPKADKSVWGVATWEDIDPRIDYFSVFVRGLTNAYRYKQKGEKETLGAPPSRFKYKTLQLNFWRAGDTANLNDREIRYGLPKYTDPQRQRQVLRYYGVEEAVDHQWVYR